MRVTTYSRSPVVETPPAAVIPSIRLISATPSATGLSSEASTSFSRSLESSWASIPSPLAPKQETEAPRKRLIPKKSKLSLLGVGSRVKDKDRGKDLSDVVRRIGSEPSSVRGGYEIYVDPTVDPDIGEILVVKKKKSRAGIDGMAWGALGEVTNVVPLSSAPGLLKVKAEEEKKWWSIGRGRKDSKDKAKEAKENKSRAAAPTSLQDPVPRSMTPEPFKPIQEQRIRFNSLDAGALLSSEPARAPAIHIAEPVPPMTYSRSGMPTAGGLLAPPNANPTHNQGSIALRAMRSVKSIARIGSWAQLTNSDGPNQKEVPLTKKEKEKSVKKKEKSDKKDKKSEEDGKTDKKAKKGSSKKTKEKGKDEPISRYSSSSFEAGALTSSPQPPKTLGNKKHSILGLGLPSTMRLPTTRSASTASSIPPVTNRLSVESAHQTVGLDRAASIASSGSSLRPLSTTSTNSRLSSGSSGVSVRWDEEGLETVKEQRKLERETKRQSGETTASRRESRRSSEGRRRTPLSEVFPEVQAVKTDSPVASVRQVYPILTIEEATVDGHGDLDDDEPCMDSEGEGGEGSEAPIVTATPMKKARARPLSEQLLGRSRPRPMYEDEDGVLSILDAATNDLAQLINNLDLQATPATPDMTPLRPSPSFSSEKRSGSLSLEYSGSPKKNRKPANESPVKNGLRTSVASISSLRPYSQSRGSATLRATSSKLDLIGQQISPWPMLRKQSLSPLKEQPPAVVEEMPTETPPSTFVKTHKRTMTPAPEPEPAPVFMPLRPPKSRVPSATVKASTSPVAEADTFHHGGTIRALSSRTFGSRSSSRGSKDSLEHLDRSHSSFLKASHGSNANRKRFSLTPSDGRGSRAKRLSDSSEQRIPISREARRMLGMSGTLGGSDVSAYAVLDLDASDPDSDVPEELRYILANSDRESINDTISYQEESLPRSVSPTSPLRYAASPSPSPAPPFLQLPVFQAQLIDDEDNHGDIDDGGMTSEDDTKKSFDFTGELKKLNESGGSDRRSFMEQLENAFRTPAKVDLRCAFDRGLLQVEVPPVPKLPLDLRSTIIVDEGSSNESSAADGFLMSRIIDAKEPTMLIHTMRTEDETESNSSLVFSASKILDMKEPTLLPTPETSGDGQQIRMKVGSLPSLRSSTSSGSHPSDGELNRSFRFGGFPHDSSTSSEPSEVKQPMTLSDVIPPPSHVRSVTTSSIVSEDDSVLKSILAKVADMPVARPRPRVNSNSSAGKRNRVSFVPLTRPSSGISFIGLDSFDEVRRGFEFNDNRPAFYPPPAASRRTHRRAQDSVFSIASVSSYGRVIDAGSLDPFDYGLPSLQEQPSSEDLSISMSMNVDDTFSFLHRRPRQRVDSDASSFYFKAPPARGHRRHESNISVSSQAPPISMYNRSFGAHRRNDSNTSASSVALSYAMHGAIGGRAILARHRRDASVDSISSDFSAMRLGRPGIGDKMFDTSDHAYPLAAIAGSPSESMSGQHLGNRTSFDSVIDDDRQSSMDDSLFDNTGNRSSVSSDSVFGDDCSQAPQGLLPPGQFRPLSIISLSSVHSPMRDDDTMISMLGGGHVRRRSIGSIMEASPCVRVEKRKHAIYQGTQLVRTDGSWDSPKKPRIVDEPRIVEKHSIASTSSYQFGGERMIKAQRGLLERQSLEENCLMAEGEDLSHSFRAVPVFSRPSPVTRSRSSTCTSESSGRDTPPLSASEGSSISGGSISSIDLADISMALSNVTHPISTLANTRTRARGHGHRRRYSKAHISRSSVYETIEEEMSNASSPARSLASKKSSPTACQPIFVVEPDTESICSPEESVWDDERGILALRRFYTLKNEAQTTVTESKRQWQDTPFSIFALQSFDPPRNPDGMKALLEQSVQNYGPLPSELRSRRVRTHSRPSPYPTTRVFKTTTSPEQVQISHYDKPPLLLSVTATPVLAVKSNNLNVAPSLAAIKPISPFVMKVEPKRENAFGLAPNARPRVASTTRRNALGWSKRSTGKSSTDQKENAVGQGITMTPGETLRINRPRPRGRTPGGRTSGSQVRTIRI